MALRTGGEVDSLCTRCKMNLAHTILAMVGSRPVRVQCNTCGGQHNFRAVDRVEEAKPARAASSSSSAASSAKAPRAPKLTFEEVLGQKGGLSRPYSPKTTFITDEVITHPVFGRGFVSAVRNDKVDVTFSSGVKTLVHGR